MREQSPVETIKGGFRKRTLPLSADYRPMYKLGHITLILQMVSSGGRSSLNRLHFFVWALKSARNMTFIRAFLENRDSSAIVSWGVEPALNRALLYGVAEGLFATHNDKYILTEKGKLFAGEILKDKDLMNQEREFLTVLGKRTVTETFINALTTKISN